MSKLRHTNICLYMGACLEPPCLLMVSVPLPPCRCGRPAAMGGSSRARHLVKPPLQLWLACITPLPIQTNSWNPLTPPSTPHPCIPPVPQEYCARRSVDSLLAQGLKDTRASSAGETFRALCCAPAAGFPPMSTSPRPAAPPVQQPSRQPHTSLYTSHLAAVGSPHPVTSTCPLPPPPLSPRRPQSSCPGRACCPWPATRQRAWSTCTPARPPSTIETSRAPTCWSPPSGRSRCGGCLSGAGAGGRCAVVGPDALERRWRSCRTPRPLPGRRRARAWSAAAASVTPTRGHRRSSPPQEAPCGGKQSA